MKKKSAPAKMTKRQAAAKRSEEMKQHQSILVSRLALTASLGKSFDGNRDVYESFGYPRVPKYADYRNFYDREGLATRVVDMVADETWREHPFLVPKGETRESAEDSPIPAQASFSQVADSDNVLLWQSIADADAALGCSRYALILLGLPGDPEEEPEGKMEIAYSQVYDEGNSTIPPIAIDLDPESERFGLPLYYLLSVGEDTRKETKKVHWKRIIHIKEGRSNSRIYGTPRLQRVLNRLYDLEKVVGGSSEAFWKLINRGMALTAKDGASLPQAGSQEYEDMVDEIDEYEHNLRRVMRLAGFDVKDLGGSAVSGEGQFGLLTQYVAGATAIPQRILLGSERGELASSQDDVNFADTIKARQKNWAEPVVLRPIVTRLADLKLIKPLPKNGFDVIWPSLFTLNDVENADLASTVANALSTITGGSPELAMPLHVFLKRYLRYEPTEDEQAELDAAQVDEGEMDASADPNADPNLDPNAEDATLNAEASKGGDGSPFPEYVPVAERWATDRNIFRAFKQAKRHGGKGSGNFGHAGRPGEIGGSTDDLYDAKSMLSMRGDTWSTQSDIYIAQLADQERKALGLYTDGRYRDWNEYLRTGREWTDDEDIMNEADARIERLRGVIANAPPVPDNMLIYRGLSLDEINADDLFVEGELVKDPAFLSTSLSRRKALTFALDVIDTSKNAALLEIRLPKGTPALLVDAGEDELILNTNTVFRVVSIQHNQTEEGFMKGAGLPKAFTKVVLEAIPS